jgi:hypothetical protein
MRRRRRRRRIDDDDDDEEEEEDDDDDDDDDAPFPWLLVIKKHVSSRPYRVREKILICLM